jgi:excisionase family DNA binding protein
MNGSNEAKKAQKEFFDVKELAEFLDVSQQTIYRMAESRLIVFYRMPRFLRFRRTDVEAYLAKCLVKSVE